MPYITSTRRDILDVHNIRENNIDPMWYPLVAGELNYKITMLMIEYLHNHEYNYATMNDIIGAVESAKAEFQRRVVAPYENVKAQENGDLYAFTSPLPKQVCK